MKIKILSGGRNIKSIMREIGYFEDVNSRGQLNYIYPLSGRDYPRFHIYPKKIEGGFELNLHFDMKKPSYSGSHAHNGEYEGDIIEKEAERIKNILEISAPFKN